MDIAVAVPADYPGTFLDFKAELTEKLIAQGMNPSDFRITDTATKIDTTDQSNWVVYDHYYNQAQYNTFGYTAEQQKTHPFRAADNTHTTGGVITMASIFGGGGTTNKCRNFISHTYSYDDNGKANMVFAGYGTKPLVDFMFYPATADTRRTVSFDLDASVIDKHTLQGAGFLLNAGVDANGLLQGYAFYIIPRGSNTNIQQVADAYIYKLKNFNAMNSTAVGGDLVAQTTIDLGAAKKLRISIDLQKDKTTVQSQPYDSAGNLIGFTPTNNFVNIPLEVNGYNGFGPIVGYTSHGCASLTVFKYLDLEMAFESSAFDALKTVQYYQGAEQKYFINLVGDSNDPGIPSPNPDDATNNEQYETNKKMFEDGINRMNENQTFYLSNVDDGHVLKDTDKEAGIQGLGTSNGFIASGDTHVDLMAQYIYQNFLEGAVFQPEPILSSIPLANFYLKNNETDKQLMTVHLQHLKANNTTTVVKMEGGSIPGTSAGDDGYINQRHLTITDPNGTVVYDSGWVSGKDTTALNNDLTSRFEFTANSTPGRYEFHLTVRDDKFDDSDSNSEALHQSTEFTTYITAFNDTDYPIISGANTHENTATITLTDTGQGIDEDGITFLQDNRGSGVIAYYYTTDKNEQLDAESEKWIRLPYAQHSISFDYVMDSTDPLYVWSMDECGNIGYKGDENGEDQEGKPAIFQPTRVVVEDPNGDVIKEYYVIGDKPIIVLPEDDEVPDPDDPENEWFAGWETPGGQPVTPGDETGQTKPIVPDENNTIVIRPTYSRDHANLVFLANGGTITTNSGAKVTQSPYQVVSGSSIMKKIEDITVNISQKGYSFAGWKLYKNTTVGVKETTADDYASFVATATNPANLQDVSSQLAKKVYQAGTEDSDEPVVTADTYYLVAQWEPGNYTVTLNANGGSLSGSSRITNVAYNQNLTAADISGEDKVQTLVVDGRTMPKRPGYFFAGWSLEKTPDYASLDDYNANGASKVFKAAKGYTAGADAPVMPDEDITVYCVWVRDPSLMLVTFDANGGSTISAQSYNSAQVSAGTYQAPLNPSRAGYTFQGWFLKTNVSEDGSYDVGAKHEGVGTNFLTSGDHEFVAQWTANPSTKYTIDYYVNSGNKDANGEYIYTKVNHERENFDSLRVQDPNDPDKKPTYTITRTAPTESTVSIPNSADAFIPEIEIHSQKYWLNTTKTADYSGTVTGSPTLSLKIYYDRYLDIRVFKSNYCTGNGTVNPAFNQKEGTRPTVSWAPDADSYVSRVTVNGVVRDDLLYGGGAGTYTPATGLEGTEIVTVEFTKKGTTPTSPVDPGTTPDPDDVKPDPRTYVVNTAVHGCTDNCTITGSKIYKAGENVTIEWETCNKSSLLRVEVDGKIVDVDGNSLTFQGLGQDHTVDVYVTPTTKPSIGAERENGFYTITVNRYGGDGEFYTSSTRKIPVDDYAELVAKGDTESIQKLWTFEWDRQDSKHRIYEIRVNGSSLNRNPVNNKLPQQIPDEGSYVLSNRGGLGYIVDVYFYDIQENPSNPVTPDGPDNPDNDPDIEYVEPDLSRVDEWVSVKTTILGGAGSIDPSFVAKKETVGDTHEVNFTLENNGDKDANDYMYYEVESVQVNGKEVTDYQTVTDGGKVTIPVKVTKDSEVVVKVKPLFVDVETSKVTLVDDGTGTATLSGTNDGGVISASRTVGKFGNYYNIQAKANTGYRLHAIEVTDDVTGKKTTFYAVTGDDGSVTYTTDKPATASVEDVEGIDDEAAEDEAVASEKADAPEASEELNVSPVMGAPAAAANTANAVAGSMTGGSNDATSDDATADGEATGSEEGEGDEASDADAPATAEPEEETATEPEATEEEAAAEEGLFAIEKAYAEEADARTETTDNFKVPTVGADGTVTLGYGNMTGDKHVNAVFVHNTLPEDDSSIDDVIDDINDPNSPSIHNVTLNFEYLPDYVGQNVRPSLTNPDGSIADDGTGKVANGGSTTVKWGDLPNYKVEGVYVDGVKQTATGNSLVLNNITSNKNVVVKLERITQNQPDSVQPTGFDKKVVVTTEVAGYGGMTISPTKTLVAGSNYTVEWEPEEAGTTADGKPMNVPYILSVTIDGVDHPELAGANPAAHSYTFDDLQSDHKVVVKTIMVNEDANGDGKPDYNIDTDGDGDPDLSVDTDGDGLPDLDVDTDGDDKPDVNIDTDGDGVPDVNIVDYDTDGKPENVDPLNPKLPNVNVDTDGDGEPDVNVDTDGDGVPDLNVVDRDHDGKPDPVDPKNPAKPNVNVDKNGDGVPDLFIDIDKDLKPDLNIDTNEDGYPDVNVDTDGDLKPDVNVDTDNTGTWKPSTQGGNKDGIWKPDSYIDTGDGKGPVHFDNTDPIDKDGDGVDDRWKPEFITKAANGFEYGTMKADWVNDLKPGQPAADGDGSMGKKLPATGDEELPIMYNVFTLMVASALLALVAAGRRRKLQGGFIR